MVHVAPSVARVSIVDSCVPKSNVLVGINMHMLNTGVKESYIINTNRLNSDGALSQNTDTVIQQK